MNIQSIALCHFFSFALGHLCEGRVACCYAVRSGKNAGLGVRTPGSSLNFRELCAVR